MSKKKWTKNWIYYENSRIGGWSKIALNSQQKISSKWSVNFFHGFQRKKSSEFGHLEVERGTFEFRFEIYDPEMIIWTIERFPPWKMSWEPDLSKIADKSMNPSKLEYARTLNLDSYEAEFCGLSNGTHSFSVPGLVMEIQSNLWSNSDPLRHPVNVTNFSVKSTVWPICQYYTLARTTLNLNVKCASR